jgi:uncharacterized protein YheU (UPF0270 family)
MLFPKIGVHMSEKTVDSFVLRFVQDFGSDRTSLGISWQGIIRHVQSGKEIRFTSSYDAINFLNNFVEFTIVDEQESE